VSPVLILYPMVALVALTFAVGPLVFITRFRAARRRLVSVDDFKFGESVKVPGHVGIPNRNLMNLLEMPVLFYVACLILYVTQTTGEASLWLAWTYVALRVAHSAVHLTYNNVFHRLTVYAVSNVVLAALWIVLAAGLSGGMK
jgi:hypothetical protein